MPSDASDADGSDGRSPDAASDADIPDDEREALLTTRHGMVVASGRQSLQRVLTTATEYALMQGLDPVAHGAHAFVWRISQLLFRLMNFGSVGTLQRYLSAGSDDLE